jgi:hypothetical protein
MEHMAHVRDPRKESIFAAIREEPGVAVTDPGRFIVEYHPHVYVESAKPGSCAYCPFRRRYPVHPQEV